MGREIDHVERPFIAQLQALGWEHVAGDLDDPAATGRDSFSEVVQQQVLRTKLVELNPRRVDGKP